MMAVWSQSGESCTAWIRSMTCFPPLSGSVYPGCSFSSPTGFTNETAGSDPSFAASRNSFSSRRWRRPGFPFTYLEKYANGWWWNWNSLAGQFGQTAFASAPWSGHGAVLVAFGDSGPVPLVQPGAPTSPLAFDQPPEYQAQSRPAPLSLSPIVA